MDHELYDMVSGAGLESILMKRSDFIKEHKKLIRLLSKYRNPDLKAEAAEQSAEMKRVLKGGAKPLKELEDWDEDDEAEWFADKRNDLHNWVVHKGEPYYRNFRNHIFKKGSDDELEWVGILNPEELSLSEKAKMPSYYEDADVEEVDDVKEVDNDTFPPLKTESKEDMRKRYSSMSKKELIDLARSSGRFGYSHLNKPELIDLLVGKN